MTRSNTLNLFRRIPTGLTACVVACERELAALGRDLESHFGQTFTTVALDPGAPIPAHVFAQLAVLVVEIDPSVPASLARIDQVRGTNPDMLLIAAVHGVDVPTVRALLRRGVNDVVSLPFDAEELFSAVIDLGSSRVEAPSDLAPMQAVVHSSGGIGASTIVSHLALALAEQNAGKRVCVVDLDLQFGEVAALFGAEPGSSILDCLEAGERLDFDIVGNAAIEVRPDIFILAAPDDIPPPEELDTDQLLKLLTMLRQHYDHVLLDLPSAWSGAALSAACSCSNLLLVVDQSLRSLSRARKTLALLDSVEVPGGDVSLVVNRAEKRLFQAIGTSDVSKALGREVIAALPLVKSGLRQAQERGVLLSEEDARHPFVNAVEDLAEQVSGNRGGVSA